MSAFDTTIYDKAAAKFIDTDKGLAEALASFGSNKQPTPFLDYQQSKMSEADSFDDIPPQEQPPEVTPSTETFVEEYFKNKGWDIDRRPLVLAGNQEALNEYDRHLVEATNAYKKQYGQGKVLRSAGAKASQWMLPATSKLLNPERPDISWYEPGFDIATLVSLGIGGAAAVGAKGLAGVLGRGAALAGGIGSAGMAEQNVREGGPGWVTGLGALGAIPGLVEATALAKLLGIKAAQRHVASGAGAAIAPNRAVMAARLGGGAPIMKKVPAAKVALPSRPAEPLTAPAEVPPVRPPEAPPVVEPAARAAVPQPEPVQPPPVRPVEPPAAAETPQAAQPPPAGAVPPAQGVPPTAGQGTGPGQGATPRLPSDVVRISSPDTLLQRVNSAKLTGKMGRVTQIPGVKQATGIINPLAVTDEAGIKLRAISGKIDDQITGGTRLVMAKPTVQMARARKAFVLNKGVSNAVPVRQLRPLPNGTESKAIHDMVEYAPWYDFGPGEAGQLRRAAIKAIRDTSDKMSRMLIDEGILVTDPTTPLQRGQIRAIQGEDGWTFLHRVVTTVKEEAADMVAKDLANILTRNQIGFAKLPAESQYQYLARFAEAVNSGTIQPTAEINGLLDRFANLADVNIKKQTLGAHRSWKTVAEGMKSGVTYAEDPITELNKQVRASYELVKKKRLGDLVPRMVATTTPMERVEAELGIDYAKTVATAQNAGKLVDYVQRILGGESPPGGAITFIRQNYPQLAARLEQATQILPKQKSALMRQVLRDATKASAVTGDDATAIARRTQLLGQIKLAFEPLNAKPNITIGDMTEVIMQTVKDKTVAAKLVKQTYASLGAQQKAALKDILTEAKTLDIGSKEALAKADALKGQYTERMGSLGTAEYGQVVGIPGISGRYVVSQEGKTGQEIASELSRHFGYLPKTEADKAIDAVGKVGAVMRMGRLGYDISQTLIQNLMALGYDAKNLATLKPTAVWAKSLGGSVRTLFSKDMNHLQEYISLPENAPLVRDWVERGGLLETAEFVEGAPVLHQLLGKIPQASTAEAAGKIGAFISKHVIGRSDAIFTAGRVEAGFNLYKAGYRAAERAGTLDEWAKATNLLTGVLSTRGMGVSAGQRSIEGAFGFMSPRFTRANATVIYDIMTNPGSYTAKEAAQSLAAILVGATTISAAVNAAQGKEISLNPFNRDWGNVTIGGQRYSLGGMMSDVRRLLAVIDSATYTATGNHLSLSGKEDKTLTLDKLFYQQATSKTAPVTGTAINVVRMMNDKYARDFNGEPITWKNIAANWITPASAEPLIKEGSLPASAAQFVGFNAYPVDMPYELSFKWRNDLKVYNNIPTDPIERKAKRIALTREQYRERNPQVDAKLFITGQVSSLQSAAAVEYARQIIQTNQIDPGEIKGIAVRQKELAKARENNVYIKQTTPVDSLIKTLGINQSGGIATAPVNSGTNSQQWNNIRIAGGNAALQAFNKVWYQGGIISSQEEIILKKLYQQYPMGESNFNNWMRRTTRQVFEKSVDESMRK